LAFPEEVIRQILLKLNNDKDVENLSQADLQFHDVGEENRIWMQLCNYHFTPSQVKHIRLHNKKYGTNYNQFHIANHHDGNHTVPYMLRPDGSRIMQVNNNHNNRAASDQNANCNSSSDEDSSGEEKNDQHNLTGDERESWRMNFKNLKRKFGLTKEEYAEELNLCKTCGILFWPTYSHHHCDMAVLIRVKPTDFVQYFCV